MIRDNNLLIRSGWEIKRLRTLNDSPRPVFTEALNEAPSWNAPLDDGY
jgi:hypothetical protein